MTHYTGERRIITIEFEYEGVDANDRWVEDRIRKEYSGVSDVRVIDVRPATTVIPEEVVVIPEYEVGNYRAPSIYADPATMLSINEILG